MQSKDSCSSSQTLRVAGRALVSRSMCDGGGGGRGDGGSRVDLVKFHIVETNIHNADIDTTRRRCVCVRARARAQISI